MSSDNEVPYSRHICSVVKVLDPKSSSDTSVGSIRKLFFHNFGSQTYKLCLLLIYDLCLEAESSLYWSKVDEFVCERIVPVSWLSHPLVLGFEENNIYFLNVL